MKKTIAMILALVTALSLCACGAKEPVDEPKNPSQSAQEGGQTQLETTQPTEPAVPNLDMFVGKWHMVRNVAIEQEDSTLIIHADGTMEKDGEALTWTAEKAHPNSNCEMILHVNYPADPSFPNSTPARAFDLRLTRTPEDTYVAEERLTQMSTTGDQYYRESDYQVVKLDDSNAMEYLQQVPAHTTVDVRGDREYRVVRNEEIKLKDGLGALSYCGAGDLVFETTYVEIHLTGDAKDFTEGVVARTEEQEQWVSHISMDLPWEYTYTNYWFGEPGSAELQKPGYMQCYRLIGTKNIEGYILIPA